jgi:hypothetical protein
LNLDVMKIMYTIEYKRNRAIFIGTNGGGDHKDCSKCSYLEDNNNNKDRHDEADCYCLDDYEFILLNGRGCVKKIKHNKN